MLLRAGGKPFRRLGIGQVSGNDDRPSSSGALDLARNFVKQFGASRRDRKVRPFARETERDGASDALARAGKSVVFPLSCRSILRWLRG